MSLSAASGRPLPSPAPISPRASLAHPLSTSPNSKPPRTTWPPTSIRVGGPADLFLPATRVEQVVAALHAAHELGVPCRVIGGASNLLVADEGIAGLVVKNLVNETRYL